MLESDAPYQLLRDGYLSNDMIEELQRRKDVILPGKEVSLIFNIKYLKFFQCFYFFYFILFIFVNASCILLLIYVHVYYSSRLISLWPLHEDGCTNQQKWGNLFEHPLISLNRNFSHFECELCVWQLF